MNGNHLRTSLKKGERVYGTLIVSTSPKWIDVVDQLHLDFVFIDTEHIAIDRQLLSWMCHAYRGKGMLPIVRIPSPDPYQACMALDGGARGIVAPYVETVEELQQLRGAVKARPLKGRKLEEYLNGSEELEPELAEYVEEHNKDHVLIINIESRPAIENLDQLLEVEGLDGVLVGPHDLSCNLGIPEQYDHPEFISAVEIIFTKARQANVGAGFHAIYEGSMEKEIDWAQKGGNLILHSADIIRFTKGMSHDIENIRQALGDTVEESSAVVNI